MELNVRLSAVIELFGSNCREEDGAILIEDSTTHLYRHLSDKENAAVDAQVLYLESEYKANAHKAKRAAEYPPMEEYMDAIVKGDLGAQKAYILKCQAVKNKYPKNKIV